MDHKYSKINVIESPISALNLEVATQVTLEWAKHNLSRSIYAANTHMLIEAYHNPLFSSRLKQADIVTPDGMPLVWVIRALCQESTQQRVTGTDLFVSLCEQAPHHSVSIFLLGSEDLILDRIQARLAAEFPSLEIAGADSLPFRTMTDVENQEIIDKINLSGAGIVFVSLGCPKQERWIDTHKSQIQAVLIGVGAVFPLYAGIYPRAPKWMQNSGLEWLYRLIQEPRLWRRYSRTIPLFIYLALKQIIVETLVKFSPSISSSQTSSEN